MNKAQKPNIKPLIFLITKVRHFKKWTAMEDKLLMFVSRNYGCRNWKAIASHFPGRTQIQCSAHYKRIKPGYNKGLWSHKEDMQLIKLIKLHGKNWCKLSKLMINRTGKQIRDRYLNSLDPNLKRSKFTPNEDLLIQKLYKKYGSKWTLIAGKLPGRSGDMIKNRFYSLVKTKGKEKLVLDKVCYSQDTDLDGINLKQVNNNGENSAICNTDDSLTDLKK
jgi:hypothetical protein